MIFFVIFFLSVITSTRYTFAELTPHIFGDDDRKDISEVNNKAIRALSKSVAALIHVENLKPIKSGMFQPEGETLGKLYNLTRGVFENKFRDQPSIARCTGFLIDDKHLMTAGHCIEDKKSLDEKLWVFEYQLSPKIKNSVQSVSEKNIYKTLRITEEYFHPFDLDTHFQDYAVIELDRVVEGRKPFDFNRQKRHLLENQNVALLGFPSGLPLKLTDGGIIRRTEEDHTIYTNVDAFAGNSGSPLFLMNTLEVVGILVRGPRSYERVSGSLLYEIRHSETYTDETIFSESVDILSVPYINQKQPWNFVPRETDCIYWGQSPLCVQNRVEKLGAQTLEELDIYGKILRLWNTGEAEIEWHYPWGKTIASKTHITKVLRTFFGYSD
jgi:V8-like Glu-specific endopeptidase